MRGGADRADRVLVVHAQRPEQADGAERAVREPVRGADEGGVAQGRVVELLADPDDRPPRPERLTDELEDLGAALERRE